MKTKKSIRGKKSVKILFFPFKPKTGHIFRISPMGRYLPLKKVKIVRFITYLLDIKRMRLNIFVWALNRIGVI
jgi:hypothetical protein